MKLQQLYSYARRAIDTWQMIDEGDKIAIGVSGGTVEQDTAVAEAMTQAYQDEHM